MHERVDFHTHYEPLDPQSPYKVIDRAVENNVVAISLFTKSEIMSNFQSIVDYGKQKNIEVIPGVEYFTKLNGRGFDLIGVGLDLEQPQVHEWLSLEAGKKMNAEVARKQRNVLELLGFDLLNIDYKAKQKLNDIMEGLISAKAIEFCNIIATSETNINIVNRLKVENYDEWTRVFNTYKDIPAYSNDINKLTAKFLWCLYFAENKPGFFPVQRDPQEVIQLLHSCGAVALYSPEGEFDRDVWQQLQKLGVDGIMAWHGSFLDEISTQELRQARQHGLLILGGSDFTPALDHWQVGIGDGKMFISPKRLRELKDRLGTIRSKAA